VSILPYAFIPETDFKTTQLKAVHRAISEIPDSLLEDPDYILNAGFMWNMQYSGKLYLYQYLNNHPRMRYIDGWVSCGPIFSDYARQLILNHPWMYFQHFVMLNAAQVLHPRVTMGLYTEAEVLKVYKDAYLLDYPKFYCNKDVYGLYLESYSLVKNVVLWLLALLAAVWWIVKEKLVAGAEAKRFLFFILIFLVVYIGFSLVAHPIVYRYLLQLHPVLLTLLFIVVNVMLVRKNSSPSQA
jgi:hypothetical protein